MATAATSRLESLRNGGSVPIVGLILVAGAAALVVGSLRSVTFAQLTVQGLALGAVYGILALALVLVYRATHVINFAQGELAMATTYVAYQLIKWGFSYWEAFFATLAIALVLGEYTISSLLSYHTFQVVIYALGKRDASIAVAVSFGSLLFVFVLLWVISHFGSGRARDQAFDEE